MSLPRLAACLVTLASSSVALAQPSATPALPEREPVPQSTVLGELKVLSLDGESIPFVGAEYRREVTPGFAWAAEAITAVPTIPDGPLAFTMLFGGLKLRGGQAFRPYASAKLGVLLADDDVDGPLWATRFGVEVSAGPSWELDFGVGAIGAFGEHAVLTDVSFGLGRRF